MQNKNIHVHGFLFFEKISLMLIFIFTTAALTAALKNSRVNE